MARKRLLTKRAADESRMENLMAVAAAFQGFRPAHQVLERVQAVPTVMIQYDHATRVGGHPTKRISLIHGPSGEGKTYATLALVRSFLRVDNPALFIDAERTLEEAFARMVLGDAYEHPLFHPHIPSTYEDTVRQVRVWCNTVKKLRDAGKLAKNACGLVVVDSIRKLVPEDQWNKITKLAKKEGDKDKVRDRSAQIKAMMNAAWCDELIPLLEQTGCTMVIIAREADDPNADIRAKMAGYGYKVGGGAALYYDASLDIRIERASFVSKENLDKQGNKTKPTIYGERHRVTIKKSKIAGKEDRVTVCYFHTSNGILVSPGLDAARDVLELAKRFEIVRAPGAKKGAKKKTGGGGWLSWGNHRWQGEHAAVKKLTAEPELLASLERAVREKFKQANPIETTLDGEVIEE
jgi:RecA/RadA recombinase